jgi:hypothetical protein
VKIITWVVTGQYLFHKLREVQLDEGVLGKGSKMSDSMARNKWRGNKAAASTTIERGSRGRERGAQQKSGTPCNMQVEEVGERE